MRNKKRLQNIIAENRYALPFSAIFSCIILLFSKVPWQQSLLTTGLLAICTLLIVELNNSNALIRIYSRMVSCSYLLLMVMAPFLHANLNVLLTQLSLIGYYLCIFKAYQDKAASGWIFYAFLSISLGSLVFVQLLFFVPILWLVVLFNILAMSFRTFSASLIGLLFPYWLFGGYSIFSGETTAFINHFEAFIQFGQPFNFKSLNQSQLITALFVVLLMLTGAIHFIRTSFKDKIRIRMNYETFIVMCLVTLFFIILQPQHFNILLGLLLVSTAPLVGHYIALTNTKATNISFIAIILINIILTAYNLWIFL